MIILYCKIEKKIEVFLGIKFRKAVHYLFHNHLDKNSYL